MEAINMVFLKCKHSSVSGLGIWHQHNGTNYFPSICVKIEKNREKFPHIKDVELAQRRRIVDEMKTIIKGKDEV
jgi:hypothetical protein